MLTLTSYLKSNDSVFLSVSVSILLDFVASVPVLSVVSSVCLCLSGDNWMAASNFRMLKDYSDCNNYLYL